MRCSWDVPTKTTSVTYTQCVLKKRLDSGHSFTTSWIPSQYAHVGNTIGLKQGGRQGTWDEGWEVVECGTVKTGEEALARERDYLNQRKASDI